MNTTDSDTQAIAPIDELDRAIVALAARINAATYEMLVLVREFDERVGWLRWGFHTCAEWLHWRCDIGLSAAREKVRVAHALKTLPQVAAAFAAGRLSYSKVRALTRVASRDDEESLVTFALGTTAARVEERCREIACGTPDSLAEARQVFARRALRMHRDPARGTLTITIELPLETGELVGKALDKAHEANISSAPEFADAGWQAQQADALVAMANVYLAGNVEISTGTADNYLVNIHVDRKALAEGKGRSGLPLDTVKRIACDGSTVTIVEDEAGTPLNVGRRTRVVPAAIRRALDARDGSCVFPGCDRRRFVDAHHVEHWANGGETSLANLVLLCTQHHRLVHEGGFRIEKDFQDRWCFVHPDGRAVPECGYRIDDMRDDDVETFSDALNYPSAEGILTRPKKLKSAKLSFEGPENACSQPLT